MACNCSKGGTKQNVIYTAPDGKKSTYRTEVEAQAAKIRNKGGSYTVVSG